jgi:gag-polypeptide of LTR copia-type
VVSLTTTRDLWWFLEEYYASISRARLYELKRQIQTASKGDSMCSYLLRLRRIADELAFIGSPLPEDELVSATINGLGLEYNSIIATVSIARCNGTFNFSYMRGLLLGHEALLQSQSISNSTAFYIGRGGNYRSRTQSNLNPNRSAQFHSNPTGRHNRLMTGPHPYGSNYEHSRQQLISQGNDTNSKPTCQIYIRFGHSAKFCYRRYDIYAEWKPNPRFKAYNDHPTSSTPTSNEWIIDSGARNYITSDINNLSSFFAYTRQTLN